MRALASVSKAKRPGIHIFIATSDLHLKHKLMMSRQEVIDAACWAVQFAKENVEHIEFSAEDASRSDRDYLTQVFTEVIKAGATVLNVPDTTGYALPEEFGALIRLLRESYNRGVKRLQNASNTTTDDRGEFRFHSLAPGTDYVVSTSTTTSTPQSTLMMMQAAESGNAASRQALQRTMQESGAMFGGASAQSFKNYMISTMNAYAGAMTPPDAVDGQLLTYQTVYYPGEVSPAQATPITVCL